MCLFINFLKVHTLPEMIVAPTTVETTPIMTVVVRIPFHQLQKNIAWRPNDRGASWSSRALLMSDVDFMPMNDHKPRLHAVPLLAKDHEEQTNYTQAVAEMIMLKYSFDHFSPHSCSQFLRAGLNASSLLNNP